MKYDDHGVISGLEEIEHIRAMLSPKDSNDYFRQLKDTLPWGEITWTEGKPLPRLVFNYDELERLSHQCQVLEELILLIEETYETNVSNVQCNYYRNGDDFRPYHRDYHKRHAFVLSLGASRKTVSRKRNSPEGKVYQMRRGDVLYSSSKINTKYEFSSVREPMIIKSRIEVTFFTDKPYIKREQHLRYINVLGVGKIPVWFRGTRNEFPEDTVAVILPASFAQMVGETIGPMIEEDVNFPVEISFNHFYNL